MKIRVEIIVPRTVVYEELEVGKVTDNGLNKRQSKLVDKCITEVLHPRMNKKLTGIKLKTVLKSL